MKERVKQIQALYKKRFGKDLTEQEMYGNIIPRLIRQMDEFLYKEISDAENILLADYISESLHGEKILFNQKGDESTETVNEVETASPSNIKGLEESQTKSVPNKKKFVVGPRK